MDKEQIMEWYNEKLQQAETQANMTNLANAQQQQNINMPEADTNLLKEQLDLGPELERIDNLLKSFTLVDGKWIKPTDENMIILSDYGVHIFREFISWYVNKNTLLSNYEEEMILDKMKDASTTLNELIFRNYEKIFYQPSFKACEDELLRRLQVRIDIRTLANRMAGVVESNDDIRTKLMLELEGKIEEELHLIKQELLRNKLKRFSFLLRVVQDTVHSAYNRAWNGAERRSIRQHMTITETKGGFAMPQEMQSKGGFFPWSRKG